VGVGSGKSEVGIIEHNAERIEHRGKCDGERKEQNSELGIIRMRISDFRLRVASSGSE